jgi:hypothetical protein
MPELDAQQAMEQAVRHARSQLADGALAQGTLEHLWRVAFAAGVRAGQSAVPAALPPELAAGVRARRTGWHYGTWAYLTPGDHFYYGGVDQVQPVCERLATASSVSGGSMRMLLEDTGENVKMPALCWMRMITEEKGSKDD